MTALCIARSSHLQPHLGDDKRVMFISANAIEKCTSAIVDLYASPTGRGD